MKVIYDKEKQRVPIKCWCDNPEDGAIEQAINLANLPFVFRHVSLMPDTHQGYGMPIGGVIGCKGVVIPNAVGVDIGCGMLAVKTSLKEIDQETQKLIISDIRKWIPVGKNHHTSPQDMGLIQDHDFYGDYEKEKHYEIVLQEYEFARYQLGTLGGGNHFIEIQKGSDDYIWFMIHSGSRNLGKKVADHYNIIAKALNAKWLWNIIIPEKNDLAFLPRDTQEAENYIREMSFCLKFAQANRDLMAKRIKASFEKHTQCTFEDSVNIHHNYATLENHFGQNIWIHRKGATSAKEGELGIIPGSQGTSSYLVKGKGERESFMSCSHGAGRKMGRNEACRTLDLEEEIQKLERKGIIHSIRDIDDLDEASGAYKDIDTVMKEQSDLVDVVVKLEPLAVIKAKSKGKRKKKK